MLERIEIVLDAHSRAFLDNPRTEEDVVRYRTLIEEESRKPRTWETHGQN